MKRDIYKNYAIEYFAAFLVGSAINDVLLNLRGSSYFNTRQKSGATAAAGRHDRFCPRRIFFADIGELLDRARLIVRYPIQKVRKIGGRAGEGDEPIRLT